MEITTTTQIRTMITLDTLKDSVYALHLTTEQDEKVMDIIETAYRLGCENGYDEAGRNYTPIIEKLMTSVEELDDSQLAAPLQEGAEEKT